MSILNSVLKLFVGDKTKKDLKKITPIVKEINNYQEKLNKISNDKLRKKTIEFKNLISNSRSEIDKEINDLNNLVNQTNDINEKEDLYDQIDQKEKEGNKITNEILDKILPEAFAVVKDALKFKVFMISTILLSPMFTSMEDDKFSRSFTLLNPSFKFFSSLITPQCFHMVSLKSA